MSYHQRVSEILPADFSKLVPVKPAAHYKYERDGMHLRDFLTFTAVDFLFFILILQFLKAVIVMVITTRAQQ